MKLLLTLFLSFIAFVGFSQTTAVNSIQIKTAAGAPSGTTPGTNWGLIYGDGTGMLKKGTLQALIGSRIRSIVATNDTTLTIGTDSAIFALKIRGGLTLSRQGYLDSLRSGLKLDTTQVVFRGAGTRLGAISVNQDTLSINNVADTNNIRWQTRGDGSIQAYVPASGATPNTYGDATHTPQFTVGADGRLTFAQNVAITGISGGSAAKKTLNVQAGTSYQLIASDTLTYIETTNGSAVSITIPDDATTAMAPPVNLNVYQFGGGKITLVPLNGNVSIVSRSGTLRSAGQYAKLQLDKVSSNKWVITGDIDTTSTPFMTLIGSFSNFTSTVGSLGTPQAYSLSWSVWNNTNILVTAPAGYVVSKDNVTYTSTATITSTGSSGNQTIYVALASGNSAGSYSGSVTNTASGIASAPSIAVNGTTSAPTPTLTRTPTSLTGFTSTAGSLGGSQNYLLTGNNLSGNITVTAPSGYQVSLNNSTFAATQTITPSSGIISSTVYVALAAANTTGIYSGNVTNTGGGATGVNVAVSGTTSGLTTTPDSVMFIFDTTNTTPLTNLKYYITGNCQARVLSGTVPGTTFTYTTNSTSANNWASVNAGGTSTVQPNDGITNSTVPVGFTGYMKECFFTSNAYQTTYPQVTFGGFKTDGTLYDIYVYVACSYTNIYAQGQYSFTGASSVTNALFPNGTQPTTQLPAILSAVTGTNPNTDQYMKFDNGGTGLAPDASGNFKFYFGTFGSGNLFGFVNIVAFRKHGE